MNTLYRAQILLESEQHEALAKIAEAEGRSVSDLMREIVQQHLDEKARQAETATALEATEQLKQIREKLREERGLYPTDPVAEVRDQWDEDVETLWQDSA